MLTTVRQKPWQKTQLWGLYKTQDGSKATALLFGARPKWTIIALNLTSSPVLLNAPTLLRKVIFWFGISVGILAIAYLYRTSYFRAAAFDVIASTLYFYFLLATSVLFLVRKRNKNIASVSLLGLCLVNLEVLAYVMTNYGIIIRLRVVAKPFLLPLALAFLLGLRGDGPEIFHLRKIRDGAVVGLNGSPKW